MQLELKDINQDLLIDLDLGEANHRGSLTSKQVPEANIYLWVDGQEYGSLFFEVRDGRLEITLGQYDASAEEWVDRNPLTHSVDELFAAEAEKNGESE